VKVVLALVAGAVLGAAATRLARARAVAPAAVPATTTDPGPDRVPVDVSAFADPQG
jgi:hypothetical protein